MVRSSIKICLCLMVGCAQRIHARLHHRPVSHRTQLKKARANVHHKDERPDLTVDKLTKFIQKQHLIKDESLAMIINHMAATHIDDEKDHHFKNPSMKPTPKPTPEQINAGYS